MIFSSSRGGRSALASSTARRSIVAVSMSLFLAVSACGSSDSEGGDAPADGGGDAVASSKQVVKDATSVPEHVAVTEPISKPIPAGKRLAYVTCGVPACNTQAEIAKEAAGELGWDVTVVQATSAPADVQAAMQQVVRDKYDGVMYAGFTKESFRRELAELEAQKVPVIAVSTEDAVGEGITAVIRPSEEGGKSGALAAEYITAQSDGKANVGLINLPAFRTIDVLSNGFSDQLKKSCESCTYEQEDLPNTVFTTGDGPARIVTFLRANPKIDWLFLSNDSLAVGLPAALKAAGLDGKVKIGGAIGSTTNLEMIKAGQQAFTVPTPLVDIVWQQVDAMARAIVGEPVEASMKETPRFLFTKDTTPDDVSSFPAIVPSVKEDYLKLWGK
jgi:ribose transport system substrate-binding protein